MKNVIRVLASALVICMTLAPAAMAKSKTRTKESVSMSGSLQPAEVELITAPMSGSVLECPVKAGEKLEAGEALLVIDTVHIYAPCDGTVAGLRAEEGDSLSRINRFYGAAMYIEPTSQYIIYASTTNAYDSNDDTMDALVDALLEGPEAFKGTDPIDSFCGMWDTHM